MARVLEVSTSGYYGWRRRRECRRSQENRKLLVEIRAIHSESDATYGSSRIHRELQARGIWCSENRVARLMHQHGIQAKRQRLFKVTTDSKHNLPVAPNLLDRDFEAEAPDQVWTADIIFIWTREVRLYFAVVMDLFSRRITQKFLRGLVDAVASETGTGDRRA